jgi:hypothetical protein
VDLCQASLAIWLGVCCRQLARAGVAATWLALSHVQLPVLKILTGVHAYDGRTSKILQE